MSPPMDEEFGKAAGLMSNVLCGRCNKPAGDVGVVIAGRTVWFCSPACTIAFLQDLFARWAQAMGEARLN